MSEPQLRVTVNTSRGGFTLELDQQAAPISCANFLQYVDDGFYDGTIFHRVINGFMIQGGGFDADMQQKETQAPIKNEAHNGLANKRGGIAMARTQGVDSATAQFFINLVDNGFLNHRATTPDGYGYAVFGEVVEGMDVVDAIAGVTTGNRTGHQDVPEEPIIIEQASRA